MKPKTLLVLALVVGGLATAVYFFEGDLPSTDERAETAKKVVPAKADEIVGLDIDWDGKKVRLERDPKPKDEAKDGAMPPARRWRMLEPYATAADTAGVDGFVAELTRLEAARDLEGAPRKDVGLEPPRGTISWRTPTASGTLEVGGKVPASSDVVVAASSRTKPSVVSDSFVSQAEKAPGEWRAREVVTAERSQIEKVTLSAPGAPPVVLAKSGEALALESPFADAADREAVDQLLADLSGLRVETFLDAPLTENTTAALAAPAGTIEVAVKGAPAPFRIEIGGGEPIPGKRIVRAGGQAFAATTKLLDSATRPAAAWRSKSWTRFESWRIERLTVDDAVGRMVLERKDGKWLRDGKEVPFSSASDLLYAISAAKAESLGAEGGGAVAVGKPLLTIALADPDGKEETLTLHAPQGSLSPARTSGRDLTLLLPASTVSDVTSKLGALRAAAPVEPVDASPAAPAGGNTTPATP